MNGVLHLLMCADANMKYVYFIPVFLSIVILLNHNQLQ